MNQENLKFLQDRLFYLGTEKRLFPELEKNMTEGKPEFTVAFSNHYDKDKLSASLHFRKSDNTEMYFLNRYDAVLQKPAQESKSQTFYLENGKGVTMKEAYNLLDGPISTRCAATSAFATGRCRNGPSTRSRTR